MIQEIRLFYSPFKYFIAGHVCLIFKMADGREIIISPQAETESFSILRGFLRQYRLVYLIQEYAEYKKQLTGIRRRPREVTLKISDTCANKIFNEMQQRALHLNTTKVTYHVIFNSCITNTMAHLRIAKSYRKTIFEFLIYINPLFIPSAIMRSGGFIKKIL